ncbi:MAG: c-type cytochrome domain-containing protein, partial [Rubripirellula sp.]
MTLHKPLDVVRFAAQLISCAFFLVLTQQALAQQDVAEPEQSTALAASEGLSPFAALLENYCVECHSSDESAAALNLEDFDTSKIQQSFAHDTGMWEKIARRVRGRQMPPANAELRPDEH